MWQNCRTFNTVKGSKILLLLGQAEQMFQSSWQKAGLGKQPPILPDRPTKDSVDSANGKLESSLVSLLKTKFLNA